MRSSPPDRRSRCLVLALFLSGLVSSPLIAQSSEAPSEQDIAFFESRIRPILIENCFDCHASDAERIRGGLVLDSREGWEIGGISGPAVVPGDPDASLLIESVRWHDEDFQMPPRKKLSDGDIHLLEEWVRRGAPDPRLPVTLDADSAHAMAVPGGGVSKEAGRDHWAFQPVLDQDPPAVRNQRWPDTEIDFHILAQLEEHQLSPAPDASAEDLIRRLSFDIRGIQAKPDEIRRFITDRSPGAYERIVDAFLASSEYGERWGRHWMDVARYAESSGKETDVPYPYAWRYRDWVIKSFNEDTPYDDFIRKQIAGDLLPVRSVQIAADHLIATGYLAVGSKSHQERNRRQFILDVADEQIDTITQGMLGLTVSCARCHDHKYDPISQKDYYQLAGVFISTEPLFGGVQINRSMSSDLYSLPELPDMSLGMPIPTDLYQRMVSIAERTQKDVDRLRERVAAEGRGSDAVQILRNTDNRLKTILELLKRYESDGSPTEHMRSAMGCRERASAVDAYLLVRGELDQPSDQIQRGVPPIANLQDPILIESGSGRLEFAEWIASAENPLTSRVMVNRIWLHLFGSALVTSTENFGLEGKKPTHPELMDHLASRFILNDWSIKTMIREIVLSHTYRMSSRASSAGMKIDPENELYWRMTPRRLEGEAIRDAILLASGTLESEPPQGSPVAWIGSRTTAVDLSSSLNPSSNSRSVYLPLLRGSVPEFLDTFDAAEPSFVTGDRDETSVPSQALFLLNDPWVMEQADSMARTLLASNATDDERVEVAFLRTLGREPTAVEKSAIRSFFADFNQLDSRGSAFEQTGGIPDRIAESIKRNPGRREAILRRLKARGVEIPEELDARQVAWSTFCQSLFACAEFRYVN
jgi:hypothetical protein